MAQDWTGGLTPGTIGLGWFPNQIGGTALSPSRGCAIQFTSTATEVISNAWVGFDTVSTTGRFMLDIYTAGSEVPSGLATASFVPTADEVNTSNLWQNQAGATSNLYQSIDNGVVNPASYVTYQGTFTQKGTYAFNIGSGAWPSGRRVLKMSFTFTGAATNNAVGRLQVVYRGSAINYVLGTATLTGTQETFTYEVGELNPDTGLPWTEADVDGLASVAGFGWRALSGATTGMEIYDASVTITYCTENRLAAGMEVVSSFSPPAQWVTFNLFNPNTGAANWSKANATDYTFVVRPLSPDGAPPGVFTAGTGSVRTLDSGAPLPTGAVGYRPLLDSSGAVVSMGDDFTFGMSLALDVNASATDSGDGMPYIAFTGQFGGTPEQDVNGATAGSYELLQAFVAVVEGADDSSTLAWSVVNPAGPTTLDSGVVTVADIREDGEPLTAFTTRGYYRITIPVSVTLAAATTYEIQWTGTVDEVGPAALSTSGVTGERGNPATYGGTTLTFDDTAEWDQPATLSTIPDPVAGFQTWQESWDTGQSGCNPTQVPYTVLRWNAASLGATFGYYQIERSIDGGDWTQVAQITSEDVERYEDKEAPFGAEVTYRISVVRAGDLIPSEWTDIEAQVLVAPECVWYFSSNLYEDILAYNAGDRTTWTFPSSDFVEISRRAGANYQQALIASEWLGDVFELDLTTWLPPNPATPSPVGEGRATFDPILDMTRAALPYICVRDWRGRVWYSNVNVTEGRDDNSAASPHDIASAVITELTDTPAIVDVEPNTDDPFLLLRVATLPDGWDVEDDWPNEGAGPATLNASPIAVDGSGTDARGATVGPDDPDVFAAHISTNVVTSFTTPHDASLALPDGFTLSGKVRPVGNLLAAPPLPEAFVEVVGKIRSLNTGVLGYDEMDYGMGIGLVAPFVPNKMCIFWTDTSDVLHSYAGGPDLDPYAWSEIQVSLEADNGAGQHVIRFYLGDGDGNFTLVETNTQAGTTDVRDEGGPLCAASFSVLSTYVQVRDENDTLVANFQAADSGVTSATFPLGNGETWTASTTGETWTVGTACAVFAAPDETGMLVGEQARWAIPDQSLLDMGSSDFSAALDLIAPASTVDLTASTWVSKIDGQIFAGGVGWQLMTLWFSVFSLGPGDSAVITDGVDTVAPFAPPTTPRRIVAATFDRSADLDVYLNGDQEASESIVAVGSVDGTTIQVFGFAGQSPYILFNFAQWSILVDADTIDNLPNLFADPNWPDTYEPFLFDG